MKSFKFTAEDIAKFLKWGLYAVLGTSGLGLLFVIIGAAASVAGLLVLGVLFFLGSCGAIIYDLYLTYEHSHLLKTYRIVIAEKDIGIDDIAKKLEKTPSEVRGYVSDCFEKGYLKNYVRVGERVCTIEVAEEIKKATAKKNAKETATENTMNFAKCKSCGASFSYSKYDLPKCPYCGSFVEEEKQ